jgi:dipeptidyl aminopeptidase/acylaminoacyl peptidase
MQDSVNARVKKQQKEKTDWQVVDDFQNNQLFVLDLTKDANGKFPVRQLTHESYNINDITWSPDGQTIAFSHQPGVWANDWTSMDISVISAKGGTVKALVSGAGMDATPIYSPDGKWIAYTTTNGNMHWASAGGVAIISSQGGQPKMLAATYDAEPNAITWSADGKNIYFDEAYHTTRHIYALPIDGGKPKKLTTHNRGMISAISVNKKGDVAFLQQDTNTPPNVYLGSMANIAGKKVTDIHRDYMVNQPMALTEVLLWKSKDNKYTIEGVVTYPRDYQKGRKYPLILNIHGGPAGIYQETYTGASSPYPIQAFASSGYVVLRANPRGSSGYGAEFRKANHRDWGNNDYEDLMTGVDKLIQDGVVHPDSLVVTGWSYGGYMTSTIITKTNRFKAAMAGAPVTNLMSFNGTADIPDFLPSYFEKEFWDDPAVYAAHSPMFNIKNAQTPTLVIHGLSDDRVPPEQGFQLYRALQRRGVPTEMVTYPRQPHGFREPKFIQDVGERVLAWFDTHLKKKTMARTVSAK